MVGLAPGQWLGPLVFHLTQISVSFKYDYPSVPGFNAHFICYGDQYCNFIAGNDADIFPFRLGPYRMISLLFILILLIRQKSQESKLFSLCYREKDRPTTFSRGFIVNLIQE